MSETEDQTAPTPTPRPRRVWLRRFLWGLLAVFLVGLVFYRPILRFVLRQAIIEFAQTQNLDLDLKIDGNFVTSLRLSDIKGKATGESPVEMVDIGELSAQYNLWRLLWDGADDFLSSYHLHDATMVLTPVQATETQRIRLRNLVRDILDQPALYSDTIDIRNLNVTLKNPEGITTVKGLNFDLSPTHEGRFSLDQITHRSLFDWKGLNASTSFVDRHLALTGLKLDEKFDVEKVVLDSSRRDEGIHYLTFRGKLFDADVGVFLWRQKHEGKGEFVQFTAAMSELALPELHAFLKAGPPMEGTLRHVWIQAEGWLEKPDSWRADLSLETRGTKIDGFNVGDVDLRANIEKGVAYVYQSQIVTGDNRLDLKGEYRFPEDLQGPFDDQARLETGFIINDPSQFHPMLKSAKAQGKAIVTLKEGLLALEGDSTIAGLTLSAGGALAGVEKGEQTLSASYQLRHRAEKAPWHTGLKVDTTTRLHELRYDEWKLDEAQLQASIAEGQIVVKESLLRSGQSRGRLTGKMAIPDGPVTWEKAAFESDFDLSIPALGDFRFSPASEIDGRVTAKGNVAKASGEPVAGDLSLQAHDLKYKEFHARQLDLKVPVANNVATIQKLELDINGTDRLSGTGSIGLESPYPYEGELQGKLSDLSIFSPLINRPLRGAMDVNWRGRGKFGQVDHQGATQVHLTDGAFDQITGIHVAIEGEYTRDAISFPTFQVQTDLGGVVTQITWKEERLSLTPLTIQIGKEGGAALEGHLHLPLNLFRTDAPLIAKDAPIDLRLKLAKTTIPKLLAALPQGATPASASSDKEVKPQQRGRQPSRRQVNTPAGPPLQGELEALVTVGGSLAEPEAILEVAANGLISAAAPKLPPAKVNLALAYKSGHLALDGLAHLPDFNPLTIKGNLPLPLEQTLADKKLSPDTPVEISIRLPTSSARSLMPLVPAIRYIEGTIGIDASASGTLGNPVLRGGLALNIPALRLQNENLPGIRDFVADLAFVGHQLTFRRFHGSVAGGPFEVQGNILFANLANPQMNLRVGSKETLLLRNDSITVRTDTDIRITGPFKQAHVAGQIGINKSRFFRDIEILPLGLPGNPVPKPVATAPPQPSINIPPFRDWTFDLTVKTIEPFLVRSNLANGRILLDIRVKGTGRVPHLEGYARVENFTASLPFSRLQVEHGYVYINPNDPLNPTIDIRGSSRIRNYNIYTYIYGTASNPETLFTSEPALAQEEIIALLATGATTEEMSDGGDALAGRAAVLVLQRLYRKVFKRKTPPPTSEPDNFRDRFRFDVGSVDPRSGRQQVGGTFQATDQIEVGAGLDLEGDVRGEIRYLIRFR